MNTMGDHKIIDAMDVTASEALQSPTNELRLQLTTLLQHEANRFDPIRFRYIETMACRAATLPQSAALIIEKKAQQALENYQQDFNQAKTDALASTERISTRFPDAAKESQSLLSHNDFAAVKRLEAKLVRSEKQYANNRCALKTLTKQITQTASLSTESPKHRSFEDFLQQQEYDIISSIPDTETQPGNQNNKRLDDIPSVRRFRQSLEKISSEKRVVQAINEAPENPGPLNQHRLAIQSLSILRDLSPRYLSRFVSYTSTLQWLEQAGKKHASTTQKKNTDKSKPKVATRRKKQ